MFFWGGDWVSLTGRGKQGHTSIGEEDGVVGQHKGSVREGLRKVVPRGPTEDDP